MHGLLASQSCYHSVVDGTLVCVHCGPVVDFFITGKQTSLHVQYLISLQEILFHLLVLYPFFMIILLFLRTK